MLLPPNRYNDLFCHRLVLVSRSYAYAPFLRTGLLGIGHISKAERLLSIDTAAKKHALFIADKRAVRLCS